MVQQHARTWGKEDAPIHRRECVSLLVLYVLAAWVVGGHQSQSHIVDTDDTRACVYDSSLPLNLYCIRQFFLNLFCIRFLLPPHLILVSARSPCVCTQPSWCVSLALRTTHSSMEKLVGVVLYVLQAISPEFCSKHRNPCRPSLFPWDLGQVTNTSWIRRGKQARVVRF